MLVRTGAEVNASTNGKGDTPLLGIAREGHLL